MKKARAICIVASAGGHLVEAVKATALLDGYEQFYVTFRIPFIRETIGDREVHFFAFPRFNPLVYIANLVQSLRIYLRKRPGIILTTGGGSAVPLCLIGRFFGSRIIFIESGARVDFPSRASRVLYRIAHLRLVQWPGLLTRFPKAVHGGPLL